MESAIRSVIKMSWPTLVIVLTIVVILRLTYIMTSDKRKFCLYEEILLSSSSIFRFAIKE